MLDVAMGHVPMVELHLVKQQPLCTTACIDQARCDVELPDFTWHRTSVELVCFVGRVAEILSWVAETALIVIEFTHSWDGLKWLVSFCWK